VLPRTWDGFKLVINETQSVNEKPIHTLRRLGENLWPPSGVRCIVGINFHGETINRI